MGNNLIIIVGAYLCYITLNCVLKNHLFLSLLTSSPLLCIIKSFSFGFKSFWLLFVFAASRESSAPAQQHLVFGGAGAHPDFSDVAAKAPASIARQKEGNCTVDRAELNLLVQCGLVYTQPVYP